MNKKRWVQKEFEWLGRRARHLITGDYGISDDSFMGIGMATADEFNRLVFDGLNADAPFAVGRTGFAEIGLMCCAQAERFFHSRIHYHWTPSYINSLDEFRENGDLLRFYDIWFNALNLMDAIGTSKEMFMSDAVLESIPGYEKRKVFEMRLLAASDDVHPRWTEALTDRNILIVSPFYKEIAIQYEKRDFLWSDGRIPKFDMSFDPSIWVNTDEGTGYFEALETLSERVLNRDFDIALLSCGHLGVPLAARIKESGKKAVVMGSYMHRLFGLKSKRLDGTVQYNEYWIRPGEDTKPSNAKECDGEAYW